MKLFNKIRGLFTREEEPELFDDMYTTPPQTPTEHFHNALHGIVEVRGISYFEAFIEYMNESSINTDDRTEFEAYLYSKDLCDEDVLNLIDEYYRLTSV